MFQQIREKLKDIKLSITKYLTPINYTEYVLKSLFILKIKHIRLLSYIILVFHIIALVIVLLFPSTINAASIIFSGLYTLVISEVFIRWRKSKIKNLQNYTTNVIVKDDFQLKNIEVPEVLKKFLKK